MTHDQDIKLFESWRGHGWCADEPPKYDIFKAMSRGWRRTGVRCFLRQRR